METPGLAIRATGLTHAVQDRAHRHQVLKDVTRRPPWRLTMVMGPSDPANRP